MKYVSVCVHVMGIKIDEMVKGEQKHQQTPPDNRATH